MVKILFFDTETTGIPIKKSGYFDDIKNLKSYDGSRLIEVAYVIIDIPDTLNKNHIEIDKQSFYIKHQNQSINICNTEIHGITNDICNEKGMLVDDFFNMFEKTLKDIDVIVSHNIEFDYKILESEYFRLNKRKALFNGKLMKCTLAMGYKKYGCFLKLSVLYKKLYIVSVFI